MTVDDALHIVPFTVDLQVQLDFAGPFSLSRNLFAIQINHTQIVRLHEPFANQRGSTENAIFVYTNGKVTFVTGDKLPVVHAATDIANQLSFG